MNHSDDQITAVIKVPAPPRARFYKMAEIAALLGLILMVLSLVLFIYYYERMIQFPYREGHYIEDWTSVARWATFSGYFSSVGWVLMVTSIVLMMRGVQIDENLTSSRQRVLETLIGAKWIAMVALLLYLFRAVLGIVIGETSPDLGDDAMLNISRLLIYSQGIALVFLATLPVIAARALERPSV